MGILIIIAGRDFIRHHLAGSPLVSYLLPGTKRKPTSSSV
jgi:hypothetical protein